MADRRIAPGDVVTPTSVTLLRRDPLSNLPAGLSAQERIGAFINAVSLVASTRRDPDKIRPDATTRQVQTYSAIFTSNPVPRGNVVTDHSIRMPTVMQFTGIITETPFVAYTARDLGIVGGQSRVLEYKNQLVRFFEEREPLFMTSSLGAIDGMAITKLSIGKNQDTGAAIEVTMTLQQVLFVDEFREEPVRDDLLSQLGGSGTETSVIDDTAGVGF